MAREKMWHEGWEKGVLSDVYKGVSGIKTNSQYKSVRLSTTYHNTSGNKLFLCETCKEVWEQLCISGYNKRSLRHTDFPSYNLKRKECTYCKEEKMHWTCSMCEKQVDERFMDLDERICDDCNDDTAPINDDGEPTTADEHNKDWLNEKEKADIIRRIKWEK
tara:strand:+ start:272 stop:757 length:486 start_codon:yes stop_codon:yes gene_type:complete